jgi:hypothetical protein
VVAAMDELARDAGGYRSGSVTPPSSESVVRLVLPQQTGSSFQVHGWAVGVPEDQDYVICGKADGADRVLKCP